MNPAKITKMDDEVAKWAKKDLIGIKRGMINPGIFKLFQVYCIPDHKLNTIFNEL